MIRFQRLIVLCLGCLAACTGPGNGSSRTAEVVLVRLENLKSGEHFELASESHTDRVTYYSSTRADAARKIQSDEVMHELVAQLDTLGFSKHARPGPAPRTGPSDVVSWGLELERAGTTAHWLVGRGSAPEDWKAFQECRDTVLQVYNITMSFQTVKNDAGHGFFGDGKQPTPGRPQ